MVSDVKYDALKEFFEDREIRVATLDFLIPAIQKLTDELLSEIDSNKYKLEPEIFKNYKKERLDFITGALGTIQKDLKPTFLPAFRDQGRLPQKPKPYKSNTPLQLSGELFHPGQGIRFLGWRYREGKYSLALKKIQEEVKFIDDMIKHVESLKDADTAILNSNLTKIIWKGDQKQLAELFITLERLDWIEPIQDGQRQSICRSICNLFDISHTKKGANSNEVNSFTEIMKTDTDKKTKVKTYPKVFTQRYKKRFSAIDKREQR